MIKILPISDFYPESPVFICPAFTQEPKEAEGQMMLAFILGAFFGTLVGVVVMCFIMGSNPLESSK
jgi:high-affinity Fe2+/Pb2+ permease